MIPKDLKKRVLVFDTETAQLGDHVCEIGFSLFEDGQMKREWGTFVKPQVPIDPGSMAVHHITEQDVENAPTFADIGWYVYDQLNMADIHVAYNYEYDRLVLEREFARVGITFPLKPMIDPFILFKQWHKYNKGKTLIKAAEVYGIPYVGAHRAMNDSTVTGKVLFKMAATKTGFPKDIRKFVAKQRQWVEAQFIDFYNYKASQGAQGDELPTQPNYSYYEIQI